MEAYKRWIWTNREFVRSIESLANALTWLLPERFTASEIGPEAVYTFISIVTTINQHIINSMSTPKQAGLFEPCINWPICISVLKDLENLVEVVSEHYYGDKEKWNFIAFMEAIKAAVRFALLKDSGFKMLLQSGEVLNIEKDLNIVDRTNGTVGVANNVYGPGAYQRFNGADPRSPASLALYRFGMNAKMASHAALSHHRESAISKTSISTFLSEKGMFGRLFLSAEVMFILRPLIYTILIKKYGLKSWKPWLVSLGVDLGGMAILSHVTCHGNNEKNGCLRLSSSEEDEMKRRKVALAFYLMRDPFFTKYTSHHLERTERYLDSVPLLGFLTAKLVELINGMQSRYTYTSAS